ncbi:hypothetical protein [Cryptosporangium sp. NPDC048952]|uniref:hypothetical protein n=1 Tax=Cryptosporangium sp. NPDC048952 TaxID=3363961 RepID=UPI003716E7CA
MRLHHRTGIVCALVVCLLTPAAPSEATDRPAFNRFSAAQLAQQILALRASGRIRIHDYSANKAADRRDRSLASQQLADIAAGKRVNLSRRCHGGRLVKIRPDIRILRFLADLGTASGGYTINVLFGQCHSRSSLHYRGRAVDLRCGLRVTKADTKAIRWGVRRNPETCRRNYHWHYSVGGR